MPTQTDLRYRAFLSYSHDDRKWGEWLHRRIERWNVPSDMVGRATAAGPVPRKLRPIFRDRVDLSASHSLSTKIEEALAASAFLIVVCSPQSAKSLYVNEEIRRFKALGRSDRVLAIIVDGEPGDPELECFPPALCHALAPDGSVSEVREEPIAADAREIGDGRDLAALKIIAGLLGVGLDEVRRREAIAQRRRMMMLGATAAVMTILAIAAGTFGWIAEQRREQAEINFQTAKSASDQIVEKLVTTLRDTKGVPLHTVQTLLTTADSAYRSLVQSTGNRPDLVLSRSRLLVEAVDTYAMMGAQSRRREAAQRAVALVEPLVERQPDNHQRLTAMATALRKLGDAQRTSGKARDALKTHRRMHEIRARLLKADPTDPWNIHELAVADSSIGLDLRAMQQFDEALGYFNSGLDGFKLAAKGLPSNSSFQHDVAIGYAQIGDVQAELRKFTEALDSYKSAVPYLERLRQAEPTHTAWPNRLAYMHGLIGDVHAAQEQNDLARANYQKGIELVKPLVDVAPDNSRFRGQLEYLKRALERLG